MQSREVGSSFEFDLTEARQVAIKTALEAGYVLKELFTGSFMQVHKETVEGLDLTTDADTKSDQIIRLRLASNFPQSQVLSEEVPPEEYSQFADTENLWIVDPLDGTVNFSRRDPNFAISIALVSHSVTKLAVIHVPMRQEIYWAQAGLPNVYLNDYPREVSRVSEFSKASIAIDWPYTNIKIRDKVLHWAACFAPYVLQPKSRGSAVIDLATLAVGNIDAYVQAGIKPWDVAAGALLVQKGGGMVTTPEGEPYSPFHDRILATNGVLHQSVLDLIRE